MRKSSSRIVLLAIWFSFFILDITAVFYLYFIEWINQESLYSALTVISGLFSPYLGVMTVFFWVVQLPDAEPATPYTGVILAIVSSLVWNIVIALFVLSPFFKDANIADALDGAERISHILNWLVSGFVGYYFSQFSRK